MKVSRAWLNNFFDQELPDAQTLSDALTFHAFEIDGVEKHGNDDILDVKVTPNRGHDCLSHRGVARELSAILKLPFKNGIDPLGNNFKERFLSAPRTDAVAITVEDASLCPRYIAALITGVKVGPSPEWLKNSLESIGQRSINNVVDATNLVMFNTGQPLHAFDAVKLKKNAGPDGVEKYHIVVRKAHAGEKLLALDNKEYTLSDSMLVIVDGNKNLPTGEPIGIAGVKGGTPAGITEQTTDIIVESANFFGVSVRKTAQALKLRTDASSRFEQVITPELAAYGMQNVVELIKNIAGGTLEGYADVYPAPWVPTPVSVALSKINQILGTNLTGAEVADAFARLGFGYKEERGYFTVVPPFERLDINIAEDLVEEVGRMVGYDKVPATPLSPFSQLAVNQNFYTAEQVREEFLQQGYSEVFTSVFADMGKRAVLNKVDSGKPFLRANLTDGLTEALKKNIPSKDLLGLKEVKLFEIGTVWLADREVVMVGTVSEKQQASEKPLSEYQKGEASAYQDLPLSAASRYQTFSRYPYIVRDVAFWSPAGTNADAVQQDIQKEAGELCITASLFDRFEKGDKTSLAFRLIFQSFERTLTEVEVNAQMDKVYAMLKAKGFEIR